MPWICRWTISVLRKKHRRLKEVIREMLWKLLIRTMGERASSYTRAVTVRDEVYIVRIEKYQSSRDVIEKMKRSLNKVASRDPDFKS